MPPLLPPPPPFIFFQDRHQFVDFGIMKHSIKNKYTEDINYLFGLHIGGLKPGPLGHEFSALTH